MKDEPGSLLKKRHSCTYLKQMERCGGGERIEKPCNSTKSGYLGVRRQIIF